MPDFIYVSDIDRTLIFSTGFLSEYPCSEELVEVEKHTKGASYITRKSLDALKAFAKENIFIPATSRTVEQYSRIDFGFTPDYAITSMGGTILKNGVVDKKWDNYIRSNIDLKEMEAVCEAICRLGHEVRMVENLFLFFKAEKTDFLNALERFPGWRGISQGKKHYAVPCHISKESAISYLKEELGIQKMAASGDSALDMDILESADFAAVPDSAYIKEEAEEKGFFIAKGGAASTAVIIQAVRNLYSTKEGAC